MRTYIHTYIHTCIHTYILGIPIINALTLFMLDQSQNYGGPPVYQHRSTWSTHSPKQISDTHTHTHTHTHTLSLTAGVCVCVCDHSRWFCHVDDDNYLNVGSLVKLLSQYRHTQDVYLGRPSLERPIQATERLGSTHEVSVWLRAGMVFYVITIEEILFDYLQASGERTRSWFYLCFECITCVIGKCTDVLDNLQTHIYWLLCYY